jgi:mediator of RNA polymerase II transcription subunit 16
MMVLQASKDNDRWTHLNTRRKPLGPYWPRALAVVTRTGSFRLVYQKPDGTWSIAKVDLRSLLSTGSLVTHAAIAPTQGQPNACTNIRRLD